MDMFVLLLVSLTLSGLCKADCNTVSGPAGSPECVELSRYNSPQWGTCLTDDYIRTFSKGKHQCEDRSDTYCYYQCMMELYTINYGDVTGKCKCNTTASTDWPANSTRLPSKCNSPSGDDCTWYRDCLEKRYPCKQKGESYAIDYAEKFCNLYDTNAARFDSIGQRWINAVRKCLQVNLVPILRPFVNMTCDEIKEMAFSSHPDCYTSPDADAPSICDIGASNWWSVLVTVKGAAIDAPWESLKQATMVAFTCFSRWWNDDTDVPTQHYYSENDVQQMQLNLIGDNTMDTRYVNTVIVEEMAKVMKWNDKGVQYFAYHYSRTVSIYVMPAVKYDFNYKGDVMPNMTSVVFDAANSVKNGDVRFNLPGNTTASNFSICNNYICGSTRLTVEVPSAVPVPPTVNSARHNSAVGIFMAVLICVSLQAVNEFVGTRN